MGLEDGLVYLEAQKEDLEGSCPGSVSKRGLAAGVGTGAWCAHMEPWGAGKSAEMLAKARDETVFLPPRLDPSTLTPEQWALV